MRIIDCEQNSREWYMARCGRVTGSRIADILAKTKSGVAASRRNYLTQLVCERLTGEPTPPGFESYEMKWGKLYEPAARERYVMVNDVTPRTVGFVLHPTLDGAGASPDCLIGEDGMIEIKCPLPATHLSTLTDNVIDRSYMLQMQWQMACTGRAWTDFVSYHPLFPAGMQMATIRVPRDEAMIRDLGVEVALFLGEVEATVTKLRARFNVPEAIAA
jgi:putative phage-type endonuclease